MYQTGAHPLLLHNSPNGIPAAAVPVGAVVTITDVCPHTGDVGYRHVKVERAHNGDPVAGSIRWESGVMGDVTIGAATRVEVVSLP